MSGKNRVRRNPKQVVEELQEADRPLNAGQSVGQVLQALGISQYTTNHGRTRVTYPAQSKIGVDSPWQVIMLHM